MNSLVKVTSRAWSLTILALLHGGIPGRQATLLAASGASRTAFAQSLRHLLDLELLERNPGHGHPLRPEYRLTKSGADIADIAAKITAAAPLPVEQAVLRRSWTIPVLALCHEPRSFSEIKSALDGITDRALSQSLKQMQTQQWVRREIDPDKQPLRPQYQAFNAGAEIARTVNLPLE